MKRNQFFYLSGFFSFLLYCAILFSIFALINVKNPDHFIVKQDTQYDSIPIEALLLEDNSKEMETADAKTQMQKSSPTTPNNEDMVPDPTPNLKDVFSSIPNFEARSAKKQEEQKRLEEIEQEKRNQEAKKREEALKRKQILSEQQEKIKDLQNTIQNVNKTLEKMDSAIDIKNTEALPQQDQGLYNDWIAEVYKILYKNWNFSFYQKTSISVLVKISNDGDFSYSILRYSQYDEYNEKIKQMLDNLKDEHFPPYPKGKTMVIRVNFKSKEKNE